LRSSFMRGCICEPDWGQPGPATGVDKVRMA